MKLRTAGSSVRGVIAGVAVAAFCAAPVTLGGIGSKGQTRRVTVTLTEASARPDLALNFGAVAKMKVASRKTVYRLGEMVPLDLAVMNDSDRSVFVYDPARAEPQLSANDAAGRPVQVISNTAGVLLGVLADSYHLLEPGHFLPGHLELLAGRNKDRDRNFEELNKLEESRRATRASESFYLKAVFERNLFVSWGDGYLDVQSPGKYTVVLRYTSRFVVVPNGRSKAKTAVGTLISAPLAITVTE